MESRHLAVDLGAESGRVMLGIFAEERISLREVHRFANVPLQVEGSLHWDFENLFAEIKKGLTKAGAKETAIQSVSVDSWGVDYLLLDQKGNFMPPAYHYRDQRNETAAKAVLAKFPWEDIYADTGLQYIAFNTLFQLAAEEPERLRQANRIVPMADAFNHLLCGVAKSELSLASTTQLYDPRKRHWSARLLALAGIREDQLPPIVPSGTKLGPILPELANETGLEGIEVVAGLSHDTAAAVAAIPVAENRADWAFLSSGTWSLIGTELADPLVNEEARRLNFTNEIGYGHRVRFLRNVIGLWLVQECRRKWALQKKNLSYEELERMAREAPPFAHLIDPDDPLFFNPDDMPAAISAYCLDTGQAAPTHPGAFVRCALESLALLYRQRVKDLGKLTGKTFSKLHVIGGGSRNRLLNQFTANALGIPVLAGPAEATALGNVTAQALALGVLPNLEEARRQIAESCDLETFLPANEEEWEDMAERFEAFRSKH